MKKTPPDRRVHPFPRQPDFKLRIAAPAKHLPAQAGGSLQFRRFPHETNSSMTKSELVAKLALRFPQLAARDTDFATNMILNEISAALVRGDRIEIRGVGSFSLTYGPPRIGRNPKSGDPVRVPAKHVPHFKAGKDLRERVGQRST
jgi:integration host factor subunit beta